MVNPTFVRGQSMSILCTNLLTQSPSIIAVATLILGYWAWKRELIGSKRIDLLEKVLANFYRARDAIADIRNPAIFKDEGKLTVLSAGNQQDKDIYMWSVFQERFARHNPLFMEIQSQKYHFMVLFGADKEKIFNNLTGVINELIVANDTLYDPELGMNRFPDPKTDEEKQILSDSRQTLFSSINPQKEDPIKQRVNAIVSEVEIIVKSQIDKYAK